MSTADRRELLAAAATAGLAVPTGARVEARGETPQGADPDPTHVFTATGTGGFLAINTDDPYNDGYPLPGGDGEPPVVIEGLVYPDGTWEAVTVEFRTFDPGDFGLPPVALEVGINVLGGLSGVLDREAGLMTVEGTLEILLVPGEFDNIDEDLSVEIDIQDGTTLQSNSMVGDAEGLDTQVASVAFVDNAYTVPTTDTVVFGIDIDGVLGLPSETSGDNWLELGFDIVFEEFVTQPPPVVGETPPTSVGDGQQYDDIDGEVTVVDVQALFDNLDSDVVQNNAAAFDFSGTDSGRVTVFDVQALLSRL
jgi:hypothetical protein